MSLTKLLMVPIRIFKKDVIAFIIIRRFDLGTRDERLRYISVKQTASVNTLRQKVWYLLELPDYCDEVIILKSHDNVEIPLTDLRRGSDPQHPYILEVWLGKKLQSSTTICHMLTMGTTESTSLSIPSSDYDEKLNNGSTAKNYCDTDSLTESKETIAPNKLRVTETKQNSNNIQGEIKKSELFCRLSNTSLIFKLQENNENYATILLKIQRDLSILSNKLSNLENRVVT